MLGRRMYDHQKSLMFNLKVNWQAGEHRRLIVVGWPASFGKVNTGYSLVDQDIGRRGLPCGDKRKRLNVTHCRRFDSY